MKPLLLMQTGDSPPMVAERCGNYPEMFIELGGMDPDGTEVIHVGAGESLPEPEAFCAAVVTGSAGMVTDREPWSEYAAGWIRSAAAAGLPMLGVCYGHQLFAHALGGTVDYLPGGQELGSLEVRLVDGAETHPLLKGLPRAFPANLAHSQAVLVPPPGARVLAESDRDPHQMLEYSPGVVSVQFHPEFDRKTEVAFIDLAEKEEPALKGECARLRANAVETPEALEVLRRFVAKAGFSRRSYL